MTAQEHIAWLAAEVARLRMELAEERLRRRRLEDRVLSALEADDEPPLQNVESPTGEGGAPVPSNRGLSETSSSVAPPFSSRGVSR